MKFLEKLKSRKLSKILSAAAVGGMLIFGGNVQAAENDMQTFRDSYLSTAEDSRHYNQIATFFGGTVFKADINAQGSILSDASLNMAGTIDWSYTSPRTKQTTNLSIPFYIAQSGDNDMVLYVQRYRRWNKITLPGFPAALASAIKANDLKTLQENAQAVKDVEIFKEDVDQRIMKLVIDGKFVASLLDKYNDQNSTGAEINRNLKKSLAENDIYCTWTFDKRKKETKTVSIDLTDLMRGYARSVLDESAAGTIKLEPEEKSLLDAIGYYSEFHYSLSSVGAIDKKILTPPSSALNAQENDAVFDDLLNDMTAVVKR
jgi:hypothetical protein